MVEITAVDAVLVALWIDQPARAGNGRRVKITVRD
eukprot:COSAG02_NODE_56688_length_284_cov_0.837838_1_plen_34_part_01